MLAHNVLTIRYTQQSLQLQRGHDVGQLPSFCDPSLRASALLHVV